MRRFWWQWEARYVVLRQVVPGTEPNNLFVAAEIGHSAGWPIASRPPYWPPAVPGAHNFSCPGGGFANHDALPAGSHTYDLARGLLSLRHVRTAARGSRTVARPCWFTCPPTTSSCSTRRPKANDPDLSRPEALRLRPGCRAGGEVIWARIALLVAFRSA